MVGAEVRSGRGFPRIASAAAKPPMTTTAPITTSVRRSLGFKICQL
jgi:hypothetical protein